MPSLTGPGPGQPAASSRSTTEDFTPRLSLDFFLATSDGLTAADPSGHSSGSASFLRASHGSSNGSSDTKPNKCQSPHGHDGNNRPPAARQRKATAYLQSSMATAPASALTSAQGPAKSHGPDARQVADALVAAAQSLSSATAAAGAMPATAAGPPLQRPASHVGGAGSQPLSAPAAAPDNPPDAATFHKLGKLLSLLSCNAPAATLAALHKLNAAAAAPVAHEALHALRPMPQLARVFATCADGQSQEQAALLLLLLMSVHGLTLPDDVSGMVVATAVQLFAAPPPATPQGHQQQALSPFHSSYQHQQQHYRNACMAPAAHGAAAYGYGYNTPPPPPGSGSPQQAAGQLLLYLAEHRPALRDVMLSAGALPASLSALSAHQCEPLQRIGLRLVALLVSDTMGWPWDWPVVGAALAGVASHAVMLLQLCEEGEELHALALQVVCGMARGPLLVRAALVEAGVLSPLAEVLMLADPASSGTGSVAASTAAPAPGGALASMLGVLQGLSALPGVRRALCSPALAPLLQRLLQVFGSKRVCDPWVRTSLCEVLQNLALDSAGQRAVATHDVAALLVRMASSSHGAVSALRIMAALASDPRFVRGNPHVQALLSSCGAGKLLAGQLSAAVADLPQAAAMYSAATSALCALMAGNPAARAEAASCMPLLQALAQVLRHPAVQDDDTLLRTTLVAWQLLAAQLPVSPMGASGIAAGGVAGAALAAGDAVAAAGAGGLVARRGAGLGLSNLRLAGASGSGCSMVDGINLPGSPHASAASLMSEQPALQRQASQKVVSTQAPVPQPPHPRTTSGILHSPCNSDAGSRSSSLMSCMLPPVPDESVSSQVAPMRCSFPGQSQGVHAAGGSEGAPPAGGSGTITPATLDGAETAYTTVTGSNTPSLGPTDNGEAPPAAAVGAGSEPGPSALAPAAPVAALSRGSSNAGLAAADAALAATARSPLTARPRSNDRSTAGAATTAAAAASAAAAAALLPPAPASAPAAPLSPPLPRAHQVSTGARARPDPALANVPPAMAAALAASLVSADAARSDGAPPAAPAAAPATAPAMPSGPPLSLPCRQLVEALLAGGVVPQLLRLLSKQSVCSTAALVLVELVRLEALRHELMRAAGWAPLVGAIKSSLLVQGSSLQLDDHLALLEAMHLMVLHTAEGRAALAERPVVQALADIVCGRGALAHRLHAASGPLPSPGGGHLTHPKHHHHHSAAYEAGGGGQYQYQYQYHHAPMHHALMHSNTAPSSLLQQASHLPSSHAPAHQHQHAPAPSLGPRFSSHHGYVILPSPSANFHSAGGPSRPTSTAPHALAPHHHHHGTGPDNPSAATPLQRVQAWAMRILSDLLPQPGVAAYLQQEAPAGGGGSFGAHAHGAGAAAAGGGAHAGFGGSRLVSELLGVLAGRADWIKAPAAALLQRLAHHSGPHHDMLTRPGCVTFLLDALKGAWDMYRSGLLLPAIALRPGSALQRTSNRGGPPPQLLASMRPHPAATSALLQHCGSFSSGPAGGSAASSAALQRPSHAQLMGLLLQRPSHPGGFGAAGAGATTTTPTGASMSPLGAAARAAVGFGIGDNFDAAQQAMCALEVMEERRAGLTRRSSNHSGSTANAPGAHAPHAAAPAPDVAAGPSPPAGEAPPPGDAEGAGADPASAPAPAVRTVRREPSVSSLASKRVASSEVTQAMATMLDVLQELAVDSDAARVMTSMVYFELYVDVLACRPEHLLLAALGVLHRLAARTNTHETFWDCEAVPALLATLRADGREAVALRAAQVLERLSADPDLHQRLAGTELPGVLLAALRRGVEPGAPRRGALMQCLLGCLSELLACPDIRKHVRERMGMTVLAQLSSPELDDRAAADLAQQCMHRLKGEGQILACTSSIK